MPIHGGIELRGVSFRYAETERFVLKNVNLKVEPGRFVTIMGPSGGGKTTLLKVMLELLEPTDGEVLVDGVPLQSVGVRACREQVGAVMQEDHLLSGSIADNVCFFDPVPDEEWMAECARTAGVHGTKPIAASARLPPTDTRRAPRRCKSATVSAAPRPARALSLPHPDPPFCCGPARRVGLNPRRSKHTEPCPRLGTRRHREALRPEREASFCE